MDNYANCICSAREIAAFGTPDPLCPASRHRGDTRTSQPPAALGLAVTPELWKQLDGLAKQGWTLWTAPEVAGLLQDHATLLARVTELEQELEGDGSHNPDLKVSLGLRALVELNAENTALLEARVAALTAELDDAKKDWAQLKACEHEWIDALEVQAAIQAALVAALEQAIKGYEDAITYRAVDSRERDAQGEDLAELKAALARVAAGGGAP